MQGKALPRTEKVYVRVPHGYPPEVLDYLVSELGGGVHGDVVELTKAGFGLLESPRLWYLEYKDTIEEIGLKELTLVPGLFRAFHENGRLRAMASIHVDDTRYAGDNTSQALWDLLHHCLKFGKMRKATDGWQKFCGRWERQDPDGFGVQISMQEYIRTIPAVKGRSSNAGPEGTTASTVTGGTSTTSSDAATTTTTGGSSATSSNAATTTTTGGSSTTSSKAATTATAGGPLSQELESAGPMVPTDEGVIEYLHEKVTGADGETELTPEERRVLGSVVGQLNWAARQGRLWFNSWQDRGKQRL